MRCRKLILACAAALLATAAQAQDRPAQPVSLKIVKAASHTIDCVFKSGTDCTGGGTAGSAGVSIFSLAGATGNALMQNSTALAAPNTPGAGRTVYFYRVDLTEVSAIGDFACITDITIDFGPIVSLQYGGSGPPGDVFVVTQGGTGSIGLSSAMQTGRNITFTFEQPICAASAPARGEASFSFGLTAATGPRPSNAALSQPGVVESLAAGTEVPALP
jgi:hypothetical protein